jgi:hypothetical protein
MTEARRYFRYHFRKSVPKLILELMMVLVVLLLIPKSYVEEEIIVTELMLAGIMIAIIMPSQEFSEFHNRRNLDTWFSLPIDRMKLGLVHYLNGALQIGAVLTFMAVGILFRLKANAIKNYGMYALLCFTVLAMSLLLYGLLCLAFTCANTSADGSTFVLAYLILPLAINLAVLSATTHFNWMEESIDSFAIGMPVCLFTMRTGFANAIVGDGNALSEVFHDSWFVSRLVLNILICAAATVMMLFNFRNRHAEKVEDISDSWFGYRTLLPIYALCAAFFTYTYAGSLLLGIVLIICYMGYRRSSKLHKSDWAVIAAYFLVSLLVCGRAGRLPDMIP